MKLTRILLESEWRPLTSAEVENDKEELFKMIDTAYAPLGGHPNVTNPNDVKTAAQGYLVIDLDDDPEDDATIMTKNRAGGTKLVGMGHDGSKPARSAAVAKTVSTLNKNGYYIIEDVHRNPNNIKKFYNFFENLNINYQIIDLPHTNNVRDNCLILIRND